MQRLGRHTWHRGPELQLRVVRRHVEPGHVHPQHLFTTARGVFHRRVLRGLDRHAQAARGELPNARAGDAVDRHSGVRGHGPDQNTGQAGQPHCQKTPAFQRRVQFQRPERGATRKHAQPHRGGRGLGRGAAHQCAFGRARHLHGARPAHRAHRHLACRVWRGVGKNTARIARHGLCGFARGGAGQTANHQQPLVWQHGERRGGVERRDEHFCGQCLRQAACPRLACCFAASVFAHQPVSQRPAAIQPLHHRAAATTHQRQPGGEPLGRPLGGAHVQARLRVQKSRCHAG